MNKNKDIRGYAKEKNVFYEILRLLAIMLVVLNHLPIATAFMTEEGFGGGRGISEFFTNGLRSD